MNPTYQDVENPSSLSYEEPQGRRSQAAGPSLSIDNSNAPNRRPTTNFKRQKSLVRPERERVDRNHPQYFYRNATQNLDGSGVKVLASTTGTDPTGAPLGRTGGVRRGKSVLGREPEKPGEPRVKPKPANQKRIAIPELKNPLKKATREWPSSWVIYYNAITCCFPAALLKSCGE